MPVLVPGAILVPQGRLGANPGALGLGQARQDRPRVLGREGREIRERKERRGGNELDASPGAQDNPGTGLEEMGGWGMNWMLVLAPHDHPGGQDHPGAIPGAPSPGAPCAVRVPELGALGRGREKKGKEGKGTGCHSRFPGRFWCPRAVWAPILVP